VSRVVRPRQARYQAALRPDMKCKTDSKALSSATATPVRHFSSRLYLKLYQNAVTAPWLYPPLGLLLVSFH
jgi:hypothetical protein